MIRCGIASEWQPYARESRLVVAKALSNPIANGATRPGLPTTWRFIVGSRAGVATASFRPEIALLVRGGYPEFLWVYA
jgi:hypothetical protein